MGKPPSRSSLWDAVVSALEVMLDVEAILHHEERHSESSEDGRGKRMEHACDLRALLYPL